MALLPRTASESSMASNQTFGYRKLPTVYARLCHDCPPTCVVFNRERPTSKVYRSTKVAGGTSNGFLLLRALVSRCLGRSRFALPFCKYVNPSVKPLYLLGVLLVVKETVKCGNGRRNGHMWCD